ncbi:MAG: hypothetical protein M1827_003788 [Pycnora praestabilis]|nr:MAG: hypothetical protein M1827_003788 [Pycnora praestabilis]
MSSLNVEMISPASPQSHVVGYSTISPIDQDGHHDYTIHKGRKFASTGGGRAWTENEEVYLLQTRLQKMPYKHIATHLKKTELACRLHYHQIAHGSNRRKRTISISSSSSSGHSPTLARSTTTPERGMMKSPETPQQHLPATFSPISPATSELSNAPPQRIHKPLLPKPSLSVMRRTPEPGLRLDTSGMPAHRASTIDRTRLRKAYDSHRFTFWKVIAADYGDNVSPLLLEEVWKKEGVINLPTPGGSPADYIPRAASAPSLQPSPFSAISASAIESAGSGFSPINHIVKAFPVGTTAATNNVRSSAWSATVMTEDREVRSPSKEIDTTAENSNGDDAVMEL